MPLSTESLDESSLNLTPMVDIVFLLIIFFMVGAHFSEIEHQFDIELLGTTLLSARDESVQPATP